MSTTHTRTTEEQARLRARFPGTLQPPYTPVAVNDLDVVFGSNVTHLMPSGDAIPAEFWGNGKTKWNRLVSTWFFSGLTNVAWMPKDGIVRTDALRHLKTVMGSWEPRHEHKEAAVAFLLSQWFDDVTYEAAK